MQNKTITIPSTTIDIIDNVDICVIGGGCTGVFAAVTAARMGAKVILIENNNLLGGTGTAAMVAHWHRLENINKDENIIAGLTKEVINNLLKRKAATELDNDRIQFWFNPAELATELDQLLISSGAQPILCCRFSEAIVDNNNEIKAIIVESKEGRKAITAGIFIDATGDCEVVHRAGFKTLIQQALQPVSYQGIISGMDPVLDQCNKNGGLWKCIRDKVVKKKLPDSTPWLNPLPGGNNLYVLFGARMQNINATKNNDLTKALIQGRHIQRSVLDILRETFPEAANSLCLSAVASALGVRETRRAVCKHTLTGNELLSGKKFKDAIANGTYPVDIHHPGGTLLRYLDGREEVVTPEGKTWGRWLPENADFAQYYQIPYSSLIPENSHNLLVCGRCIGADRDAFSATRVMVNCNQTGEAAGAAAAIAARQNIAVQNVNINDLHNEMQNNRSIIL